MRREEGVTRGVKGVAMVSQTELETELMVCTAD